MVVAGEKVLPVVQDQGEVLLFKRAKIEQEIVFLLNSKFSPLVGIDLMKKSSPGVKRDLLKNDQQGMGANGVHPLLL